MYCLDSVSRLCEVEHDCTIEQIVSLTIDLSARLQEREGACATGIDLREDLDVPNSFVLVSVFRSIWTQAIVIWSSAEDGMFIPVWLATFENC